MWTSAFCSTTSLCSTTPMLPKWQHLLELHKQKGIQSPNNGWQLAQAPIDGTVISGAKRLHGTNQWNQWEKHQCFHPASLVPIHKPCKRIKPITAPSKSHGARIILFLPGKRQMLEPPMHQKILKGHWSFVSPVALKCWNHKRLITTMHAAWLSPSVRVHGTTILLQGIKCPHHWSVVLPIHMWLSGGIRKAASCWSKKSVALDDLHHFVFVWPWACQTHVKSKLVSRIRGWDLDTAI